MFFSSHIALHYFFNYCNCIYIYIYISLRILGPSNGGVGTCIAGVRVLKIGTFEGSGYLGLYIYIYYRRSHKFL